MVHQFRVQRKAELVALIAFLKKKSDTESLSRARRLRSIHEMDEWSSASRLEQFLNEWKVSEITLSSLCRK